MSDSRANPFFFSLTKKFLHFIQPNTSFNLKEQLTLHNTLMKTFPLVSFGTFLFGEGFAFLYLKRFGKRLHIQHLPHRVVLAYVACGVAGAIAPLPSLGYMMERDLMKLDVRESPQSAILLAQEDERKLQRKYNKSWFSFNSEEIKEPEREEFDWGEKEQVYVEIAEKLRKESKDRL